MFFVPGPIIAFITFPGIIVHEIAHRFFCDIAKVPVYEVKYLQFASPPGYVLHANTSNIKDNFLISIGPLFVNSIICMILTLPLSFSLWILDANAGSISHILLGWLGISIGMHAFPSGHDLENFKASLKQTSRKNFIFFAAYPFALLLQVANGLSAIWFDLIYAVLIAMIFPNLFLLL